MDLRLQLVGARVVIEVWDPDPTPPRPREPAPAGADPARADPRVGSFTYSLPSTGGKIVRVELEALPDSALPTQEPALPRRAGSPHRQPPPAPARPVEVMTDLVLLQRILHGLRHVHTGDSPRDGSLPGDRHPPV